MMLKCHLCGQMLLIYYLCQCIYLNAASAIEPHHLETPMDFSLSDDQQALVDSARRFSRQVLTPGYQVGDKLSLIHI